ncbi:hypothetical protein SBDP1_10049 [Syntrophobacter sp. SbD1]|nr:hypothetical protein SBDP1_10049 [Syntrophobacter sp. SbD1]
MRKDFSFMVFEEVELALVGIN